MQWKEDQMQAISCQGTLLVSAAAGAGKTAVLTERICRQIYGVQGQEGTPVKQLLVLTFTKAAAAEMKKRIKGRLREYVLEKDFPPELPRPDEEKKAFLRIQLRELGGADISTVHSFCTRVIKRHGYRIGMPATPRVLDELEKPTLQQRAKESVLEAYSLRKEEYGLLLRTFGSEDALWEAVSKVNGFLEAQPEPSEWLREAIGRYACPEWLHASMDEFAECSAQALRVRCADLEALLENLPVELAGVRQAYTDDLMSLSGIAGKKTYDGYRAALLEHGGWTRMNFPKNYPEEIKKYYQAQRKKVKDALSRQQELFAPSKEEELLRFGLAGNCLQALGGLILTYRDAYKAEKEAVNAIDFSDMEHNALELLKLADIRDEYRNRYRYVAVDEYQDTNAVQEALVNAVSDGGNLFFVGDIKQSIYRFRQAKPELFRNRRDRCEREPGEMRIDLSNNFRSSGEVIDSVNDLFRSIMRGDTGVLDYDAREQLVQGNLSAHGRPTELHLIEKKLGQAAGADTGTQEDDCPGEEAGEPLEETPLEELMEAEVEARLVAKRIHELIRTETVQDKQGTRPLTYRDFAILLRSGDAAVQIAETLAMEGIPCYAQMSGGYFDSIEVLLALNILRVLDNPLEDIPLLSVLRSSIGGFSAEDLAAVRIRYCNGGGSRKDPFHQAFLKVAAQAGEDDAIAVRCDALLKRFSRWRECSSYTGLGTLLTSILEETGLYAELGVLPGGEQRQANLDALVSRAYAFEQGQERGISAFLRFMQRAAENNVKYGNVQSAGEDVVRIMTIHASKGLEFPVVFLMRLGKQLNTSDQKEQLCLHEDKGIGLKITTKDRVRQDTICRQVIAQRIGQEQREEEMRVLYVAVTRAREQLILVGTVKDAGELAAKEPDSRAGKVADAKSMLDWVLMSPREHLYGGAPIVHGDPSELLRPTAVAMPEARQPAGQGVGGDAAGLLSDYLAWRYPHADDAVLPTKAGVSAVIHKKRLPESMVSLNEKLPPVDLEAERTELPAETVAVEAVTIRPYHSPLDREPGEEKPLPSATDIGTAVHAVMEHLPSGRKSEEEIILLAGELAARGIFPADIIPLMPLSAVAWYTGTPLYARQTASPREERELPFTYGIAARELYEGTDSDETVLLQGIIDCCFLTEDGWVLVDYKTDRPRRGVSAEKMAVYHAPQLDLYAKALERLTGIPVAERHIVLLGVKACIRIA